MAEGSARIRTRPSHPGWWVKWVLAFALLPALGGLFAPLISDDGAVLGYVHGSPWWRDWFGPQYDLRLVLFWRPLVTSSLALQEAVGGTAPVWLRSLNLACHAFSAVATGLLAARLGAGRWASLATALLAASFPFQGGTVTWIVGRVDSLCLPFCLAACLFALDGRRLAALLCAFGALAAKEQGFSVPLVGLCLAWGRGDAPGRALRTALPLFVGTGIAALWRWLALGVFLGGYPSPTPGLFEALGGGARALWGAMPITLVLLPVVLGAAHLAGSARPRAWAGALLAATCALAPLVHLFAGGAFAPEHQRTLLFTDALLMLALGTQLASPRKGGPRVALLLFALLLFSAGLRGVAAYEDNGRWRRAGVQAQAEVEAARSAVEGLAPSARPVLAPFSRTNADGLYVLQWGVAERFRPPFPASPRPVWPARPLFPFGAEGRRRPLAWEVGPEPLVVPDAEGARRVPLLELTGEGGEPLPPELPVDRSLVVAEGAADASQAFVLPDPPPGTRLELVVYTPLGYEPAAGPPAEPGVRFSLRDVLLAKGFVLVHETLLQAADVGAEEAWLEVRCVRAGPEGEVVLVAAAPWIRLVWERDALRELLLPD